MNKSRAQAVCCMLIAVLFGFIALGLLIAQIDRMRAGEETSAQVVKVVEGYKSGYLVVRFTTANGQSVRVRIDQYDWGKLPEPGDRVKVRYVPGDHDNAAKPSGTSSIDSGRRSCSARSPSGSPISVSAA